jgi:hypothetical protein
VLAAQDFELDLKQIGSMMMIRRNRHCRLQGWEAQHEFAFDRRRMVLIVRHDRGLEAVSATCACLSSIRGPVLLSAFRRFACNRHHDVMSVQVPWTARVLPLAPSVDRAGDRCAFE